MSALGGEFNRSTQQCSYSIGGSFESQGLPWALIEPLGDLVQVGLKELRQIYATKPALEANPHHEIIKALASLSDDDRSFKQRYRAHAV